MIAAVLTGVGLVLLLSFKTPSESPPDAAATMRRPTDSPVPTNSPEPSTTATQPTAQPTQSPSPQTATGTVTGPVVSTQFGDVQLQVTLAGGKIVDIKPIELPFDRQRSAYISSVAAPLLRQEALQAQSAQIDLISGATYTSEAYAESLQAVLDRSHG
jgi:uncharacterized protein with FMN-binding domain